MKLVDETEESLIQLYNLYISNSNELDTNGDIAMNYLKKLLKFQSDEAICIYAGYIIRGKVPLKTKEDGKKILEKLMADGSKSAIDTMADYILLGYFEEYSNKEALKLWNELSKKSVYGSFKKALYIYNYEDKKKGEKLIKKYAYEGLGLWRFFL